MWIMLLDSFVHALLFSLIGLLLWTVVEYGNFKVLNQLQQTINYVAMGILSIGIWLGLGFGNMYLLFEYQTWAQFIPILPIRGFIGLLIYLLIIQSFNTISKQNKENEDELISRLSDEETVEKRINTEEMIERITVKTGAKIHVINVLEIIYLQADGDYVQIHTREGKYLKEQTMKYFEEHLPQNKFVRVHRSIIVNVEMISRIELYEKQNQLLTMKNGHAIKTSSSGYKSLRIALNM